MEDEEKVTDAWQTPRVHYIVLAGKEDDPWDVVHADFTVNEPQPMALTRSTREGKEELRLPLATFTNRRLDSDEMSEWGVEEIPGCETWLLIVTEAQP